MERTKIIFVNFEKLTKKNEWRDYLDSLPIPTEFLTKDDFVEKYGVVKFKDPVAYLKRDVELKQFISNEEMKNLQTISQLRSLTKKKLKDFNL